MYTLVSLCIIIIFFCSTGHWIQNPTGMRYHWATSTAGSTTLNFQALSSVVSYIIIWYLNGDKWDHLTKITATLISKVIYAISEYYTPLLQFSKFYFPISNYIIYILIYQVSNGENKCFSIFTILYFEQFLGQNELSELPYNCTLTYLQQSVHYH